MKNQLSQEIVSLLEDYGVEITEEIVSLWNQKDSSKETKKELNQSTSKQESNKQVA